MHTATGFFGKCHEVQKTGIVAVNSTTCSAFFVIFADFLVDAKAANLNLKFYGGDALADYTVLQNINGRPSELANLTVVSVAPGSMDFVNKYRKFTNNAAYSAYAAHAYDAMEALLKAYKAASPPKDGTSIAQQLGKQKFAGKLDAALSGLVTANTGNSNLPGMYKSFAAVTGLALSQGQPQTA